VFKAPAAAHFFPLPHDACVCVCDRPRQSSDDATSWWPRPTGLPGLLAPAIDRRDGIRLLSFRINPSKPSTSKSSPPPPPLPTCTHKARQKMEDRLKDLRRVSAAGNLSQPAAHSAEPEPAAAGGLFGKRKGSAAAAAPAGDIEMGGGKQPFMEGFFQNVEGVKVSDGRCLID
jgi:hypothetical protein